MTSKELRKKFIEFFEGNGHKKIESASLLPTDQSVLFTTAGMQPLVPYLLGEKHPAGDKLVNIQRCIRTNDIDEVGDDSHGTFFEMLGYWSLGAYWKKEAIKYTFEFFTQELNVAIENIAVTCFEGDETNSIAKDTESAEIWESLGIPKNRIAFLGYDDNYWGPTGIEGPCGPDTEIFVWTGDGEAPFDFDPNNKDWVEIGNDVFMQYNKTLTEKSWENACKDVNPFGQEDFKFESLNQKNVDFGTGFERALMVLNNYRNIYETDLYESLILKIEDLSLKRYMEFPVEMRIIADHIKASVFALNDGILPSNKDQGYVIRRLIRRAIVKAYQLGLKENFLIELSKVVYPIYDGVYEFDKAKIEVELEKEEVKFRATLSSGMNKIQDAESLSGKMLFDLHQSFGLPLEIAQETARFYGVEIVNGAVEEYKEMVKKHQELSRTASVGMFKGGLASGGEMETKYHTATHLLLAALRKTLGNDVNQKGANITAERIRFDFNYPDKLTPEQIKQVEDEVNKNIVADLPVDLEEMLYEDAKKCGATGNFENKYGTTVKVYTIAEISKEICGGPHVAHTGELGHFKISKEESSSSGIRRIKAILE
ncbi:TPA: alanine--tRNA ligase [Candidatus Berkelbacteria bacterium]|uniref:alanine--tRNA ligase n=1 Tax=Berkelbacteria bacterium GW2011_GWE1_39_12 TaxID=1618337 RepID=A0A0G4B635_9BACT|nr:MAG: alanyl-tRNA synthetase, alanyl-tRNA synthetase [Berkelbacteria bacterium GW2011_GWE1_39_12]HBO61069.1 alanine--tRNA ligase [Candidatus Berkelbacteria bacterium]